jgi:signal peptidase I
MADDLEQTHKQQKDRESILETLESIVIAFVLAFVFRAFIIEAFVIPTGSMAPTLNGAHAEVKCSDCGCEFAVGAEGQPPRMGVCPNCLLQQDLANRRPFSGDRILVLKYLYDFQDPQRWDVIVFHNPNDPAQNYIKRLVALPGETLELQYGNVTIDGHIAHKTDKAQDALWMLVHDTRFQPTRAGWKPRWIPDREWQPKGAGFTLETAPGNDHVAWLQYRHWVPRDGGNDWVLSNITDSYGYNSAAGNAMAGGVVCTDLGLRTSVTARSPASAVVFHLRAYKDDFRFELTAKGSQNPTKVWVNGKVVAQSAEGVLTPGKPAEVQVANVDHKVMLVVNGERPVKPVSADQQVTAEGDVTYEARSLSADERYAYDDPIDVDARHMATEVDVGAHGGAVDIAYLRLDRDVFYRNEPEGYMSRHEAEDHNRGSQGNPFALREGEYFVCGDNSPRSLDSRLWSLPRPVVPQRNLVGKAFFVYWPSAGWRYGIPAVAPDASGWRMVH